MSIVFIAADADTVRSYRAALPTQSVTIIEALSADAYRKIRPIDEKGGAVFAAFGQTSVALRREGVKSPIVEIELTSGEMVEALIEARAMTRSRQPVVAVIGFNHMIQNLIAFKPFLNLRVNCYLRSSAEDVRSVVERAIAEGARVILGGTTSTRLALQRQVPAVRLRPRSSSILAAYEEAAQIEYARGLDDHRSSELKAILDYTDQGIIAINSEQRITVFNPAAERISGIREEDVLGSPVQKTFPLIRFRETMQGQEQLGQIVDFGHATAIVNRVPVSVTGKVVGAVATLQDITAIQALEARIRRKIYSKGHVAKFSFQDIVGESPALKEVMEKAASYATVDSTVLIHGETGVGKELFAQGIHRISRRKGKPFVAVNCAALPENLLESELFGYVEGAFTGARRQGKPGLFELAHGGTIFLDEVSEIPLSLQGRLPRVLQEREVVRLGHDRVIPIDVRILCATNREIRRLVEAGGFRNDLYWRLNVLSLTVPPLRERPGDVRRLIGHFLGSMKPLRPLTACFSEAALEFLAAYPWPGNIRELRNFCERVVVGPGDRRLDERAVRQLCDQGIPRAVEPRMDESERIQGAIEKAGGRVDEAARELGIHRTTLWRWRQRQERVP